MDGLLKLATTVTVSMGPFLDKTDFVSEETGLAGTMAPLLSKNGGIFAARNSATAPVHDTGLDGHYRIELDDTDTGTAGILRVAVHAVATHLPVVATFQVIDPQIYTPFHTTTPQGVNLTQIDSNAPAAVNLKSGCQAIVPFTVTGGGHTTTVINTDLTETTDDHYAGMHVYFTANGNLTGQATKVESYDGTTKALTVQRMTESPNDTQLGIIT